MLQSVLRTERYAGGEHRKQRLRRCAVKRAGVILTIPGQPSSSAALNKQRGKNTVNSSRLLQAFGYLDSAARPVIDRNLFGKAIAYCR